MAFWAYAKKGRRFCWGWLGSKLWGFYTLSYSSHALLLCLYDPTASKQFRWEALLSVWSPRYQKGEGPGRQPISWVYVGKHKHEIQTLLDIAAKCALCKSEVVTIELAASPVALSKFADFRKVHRSRGLNSRFATLEVQGLFLEGWTLNEDAIAV